MFICFFAVREMGVSIMFDGRLIVRLAHDDMHKRAIIVRIIYAFEKTLWIEKDYLRLAKTIYGSKKDYLQLQIIFAE